MLKITQKCRRQSLPSVCLTLKAGFPTTAGASWHHTGVRVWEHRVAWWERGRVPAAPPSGRLPPAGSLLLPALPQFPNSHEVCLHTRAEQSTPAFLSDQLSSGNSRTERLNTRLSEKSGVKNYLCAAITLDFLFERKSYIKNIQRKKTINNCNSLPFFSPKLCYVVIIIGMMTMHSFLFKSATGDTPGGPPVASWTALCLGKHAGCLFRAVSGCPTPYSLSRGQEGQ